MTEAVGLRWPRYKSMQDMLLLWGVTRTGIPGGTPGNKKEHTKRIVDVLRTRHRRYICIIWTRREINGRVPGTRY